MADFTQQQVADQCRIFGPQLTGLPPGIDGAQLLWAMSGNESSFGANCTPRHEPAFDVGGVYETAMMPLLRKFGSAAACSYGPLQLMFANAPSSATPSDFEDIKKAFTYSIDFLHLLLGKWKPRNLTEIGECWNAGHPMESFSAPVAAYVQELTANYQVPMPE